MAVAMMAAVAASSAAAAASAAANAERAAQCGAVIAHGVAPTATRAEITQYAGCADWLYPQSDDAAGMRVVVAAVLLCLLIGAVVGAMRQPDYLAGRLENIALYAVGGLIFGMAGCLLVGAILFVVT